MSALDIQVGGEHYKTAKIQPVQYIEANGLLFLEGCVIKRVTRHDKPTGKGRQDIEKAIHELQLLLELRYGPTEDEQLLRAKANAQFAEALLAANSVEPAAPKLFSELCAEVDALIKPELEKMLEPAAQIDDESDRQQAVAQNGNDGLVYEDPWYGAPEWARFKAQDEDGQWHWYEQPVTQDSNQWLEQDAEGRIERYKADKPNPNWRDTLIERTSG